MEGFPNTSKQEIAEDQEPFQESLRPSALKPETLLEVENHPDTIIRKIPLSFVGRRLKMWDAPPHEALKKGKDVFSELKEAYGIDVIPFETVIGSETGGGTVAYLLTRKIEGVDLEKKQFGDDEKLEAAKTFDLFFLKLAQYLDSKFTYGGYFLSDIWKGSQYIYGNEETNLGKNNTITLVDIELYAEPMAPEDPNPKTSTFSDALKKYAIMLNASEHKIGCKFENARAKLTGFLLHLAEYKRFQEDVAFVNHVLL